MLWVSQLSACLRADLRFDIRSLGPCTHPNTGTNSRPNASFRGGCTRGAAIGDGVAADGGIKNANPQSQATRGSWSEEP